MNYFLGAYQLFARCFHKDINGILINLVVKTYLDTEWTGGFTEHHHLVLAGQVIDDRFQIWCWWHLAHCVRDG
jgi:hypothetical protein